MKTIIRTDEELRNIVNNNPFIKQANIEIDKLYITLMVEIPDPSIGQMKVSVLKSTLVLLKRKSKTLHRSCPRPPVLS
ncbi:hypothetical protein K9O30_10540 [Clostridium bowmanii]|uniref:hypothetical protein n=1 Tax=Clostridium bowmanii TaxID=132925 RepID=UPI001C0DE941|nr:hypothetical protein [Clostridium bowmanii]MCA1074149.1 hypothetical protein [Clostridium bowmanii]